MPKGPKGEKRASQRDHMRQLVAKLGPRKEAVCRAYVADEAAGLVNRKSRVKSAEAYADALWRDGVHKGWLNA